MPLLNSFHEGMFSLLKIIDNMPLTKASGEEMREDTIMYSVRMASDLMAIDGELDDDEILQVISSPAFDQDTKNTLKELLKVALQTQLVTNDDYLPKILSKAIQLDLSGSSRFCTDVIIAFNSMAAAVLRADGDYDHQERNYHEKLISKWVENCTGRGVQLYL